MRRDTADAIELHGPSPAWSAEWTPAGVVEALEAMVGKARRARIRSVLDARLDSVTVLMDAPHDPHNGAALLRSCDAFGVQTVHIVPREEIFQASRTVAKGTERWVDVQLHPTPRDALQALGAAGYEIIATHPEGELEPHALSGIPRVALLFGNEHDGIRAELLDAAARRVRIPMRGFVESLNVSVAAGILLQAATRDRPGDLTPEQRHAQYAMGLFHSVQRARDVLAALPPR